MIPQSDWPDLSNTSICSICLHRLSIPLRQRVEHAASERSTADPIVVSVELQDGTIGYGETLPRPYVTGEDHDSVEAAVKEIFVPLLVEAHPESFSEALEFIEALPMKAPSGRAIPAARAAIELALLDVYSRYYNRPIGLDVTNWLELAEFGPPGCVALVRCSGVIATADPRRALRSVRRMRCYGLRDFKLKVGSENGDDLVAVVAEALGPALRGGGVTLRLDANGAWSSHQAVKLLRRWSDLGISFIEQPLAKGDEDNLPDIKAHTHWKIIHDESLVTLEDAQRLTEMGVADCFNIRISKCGGLIPALKLANYCRQHHIEYLLGCMVGQTSILSAAERRFLEVAAGVRFVESNYGRFLLKEDIARPSLRFRYGGRLKSLSGPGWGVQVRESQLQKLSERPCSRWRL